MFLQCLLLAVCDALSEIFFNVSRVTHLSLKESFVLRCFFSFLIVIFIKINSKSNRDKIDESLQF